jgi:cytochrome c oxidase assembly factor CtaG
VSGPDPWAWSLEPLYLALVAVCGVVYARAARRERVHPARIAAFALGLLLVAGALNSPLETIAVQYLVLIHLLQNAMIADWAPPLLIVGLTPAMRASVSRRAGPLWRTLTRPRVALPLWLVIWYGVHLPGPYELALRHPWALNIEHALLILAGLLFWWPVLAVEEGRLSTGMSLVYLCGGFFGAVFLGLAFMFTTAPFYDYYVARPRLWGLSPIRDQNLGGVLMNAEQTIVFVTAMGWVVHRMIREEDERERELGAAQAAQFGLPPPRGAGHSRPGGRGAADRRREPS